MKLTAGIVFVCFFLLTDAARVPDYSESSNSDVVLDDVKNVYSNSEQNVRRRKRHYSPYSRNFWEREMERSDYESYQEYRITVLETRLKMQQELINQLLFRRQEPQVIVVPVYLPSSGNKNTSDPLDNKFGQNDDDIENERIWGSNDDQNGMRPISLTPITPSRPMPKQPPVQHGTIQAETSTKAPTFSMDICKTAILICCDSNGVERKNCFKKFNCTKTSNSPYVCDKIILDAIKNDFIAAYAPDVE